MLLLKNIICTLGPISILVILDLLEKLMVSYNLMDTPFQLSLKIAIIILLITIGYILLVIPGINQLMVFLLISEFNLALDHIKRLLTLKVLMIDLNI